MVGLNSVLAACGHHPLVVGVLGTAYLVWRKLPWWIAAMRAATSNDPEKAERARNAVETIKPPWRWPWQRDD
jgi:threonine/homoserine/homoserine lactone efflux protein